MESFLVIGAGDFQLPLVQAAAKRFRVVLAAPRIPDVFMPYISASILCDVRDGDAILNFAREQHIVGVMTDQTDIAVRTVAYVAEQMGLPGIGYETACLFTDKSLMRKRLTELDIKQLANKTVDTVEEALAFYEQLERDVILKPLDTQGSRGVYECCSADEIREKFDDSARWSTNGKVIVEQMARGREFYVEGLAFKGAFQNLFIGDTDFFDLPGVFAARTRINPTDAPDWLRDKTLDLNKQIIEGFGLSQGITHSEFITDGDDVYLLETAARGAGVFISSDQISLATGLDVENFLIDIATGTLEEAPSIRDQHLTCGYMAFYLPSGTISSIEGRDEVLALPYVYRHQLDNISEGMLLSGGAADKTSRYAITVSAPSREELLRRMDQIRATLRIKVLTPEGDCQGIIW